jgi:hypothetical protein
MKTVLSFIGAADRWYVTNGSTAVGPVRLDLLARGIEAGKVPPESFVRHEAWKVWRPVAELVEALEAGAPLDEARPAPTPLSDEETPTSVDFAPLSREPEPYEPEPVSTDDVDTLIGARPMRPDELTAADTFAGAADLRDALLLLLSAAVGQSGADVALVHEVTGEGAVALAGHGPGAFAVLGEPIRLLDPVFVAAAGGNAVVAEPSPGPAGAALLARLGRLGPEIEAGFMLPVQPSGRLLAMIEVGRREPFRPREVAAVEELVQALVATVEASAWA